MPTIQENDRVRCLHEGIDNGLGEDMIGRVTGFARYSSYHEREAFVKFGEGHPANGWFWVADLERLEG